MLTAGKNDWILVKGNLDKELGSRCGQVIEKKSWVTELLLDAISLRAWNFQQYLFRIQKVQTGRCKYCGEDNTAEHTIFQCECWVPTRRESFLF